VGIDDVLEKKLAAVEALPSQFYEGGANGGPQLVPSDEAGKARRKSEVREGFKRRFAGTATQYRAKLVELYGKERGDRVGSAEAFQISEYGRRPNADEIKRLFPFFGER
jgi:N-acetylglucosamine malate deacetylase 1